MSDAKSYDTEQEAFWAGSFGTEYIGRNRNDQLLASNLQLFAQALRRAPRIESCVELGANIGLNLKALKLLYPDVRAFGVEINPDAARELRTVVGNDNVFEGSLLKWKPAETVQLALIKGVLIHLNPDALPTAYETLYQASSRYILVTEYYNRTPVSIGYRGHGDRLFKRDFAGELLDRFPDLELIDYGFSYHRDRAFPQDDATWFLMEKRSA